MKKMMPMMLVMLAVVIASAAFAWQGVSMHARVSAEEAKFHELQNAYFSINKAEREAAPTNSPLTKDLVKISNYPSELLRLKLVGVGKILTGIFILLFGILLALIMMPVRLKKAIKES